MVETTLLVVSGKKLTVPRILKRSLQIAIAVALTALLADMFAVYLKPRTFIGTCRVRISVITISCSTSRQHRS